MDTMSKEKTRSRLAEILGVEEDEVWMVNGWLKSDYRIHGGVREYRTGNDTWIPTHDEEGLAAIIANPEIIIRKPQFTDDELGMLRCLRESGVVEITRNDCGGLSAYNEWKESETCAGSGGSRSCWWLPPVVLPTIQPGQSIKLADILGEEDG